MLYMMRSEASFGDDRGGDSRAARGAVELSNSWNPANGGRQAESFRARAANRRRQTRLFGDLGCGAQQVLPAGGLH